MQINVLHQTYSLMCSSICYRNRFLVRRGILITIEHGLVDIYFLKQIKKKNDN